MQHRGVLIAWTVTIGAFLAGILGGVTELILLPLFAAMALAVMTVKRAERTGELRRALLYRASLLLLLLATVTCLVAAGFDRRGMPWKTTDPNSRPWEICATTVGR